MSVWINEDGGASIVGVSEDARVARYGQAYRDDNDLACWDATDIRICVY